MAWIEEYLVRRKIGQLSIDALEARQVEAFLILEQELAKHTPIGRREAAQGEYA